MQRVIHRRQQVRLARPHRSNEVHAFPAAAVAQHTAAEAARPVVPSPNRLSECARLSEGSRLTGLLRFILRKG